jgi:branched chain amino acid efflux pump
MIEHDPVGFAAMLAAMTAAVFVCRVGGYWLLGRFTIGPRLRRMLDALPGAVIASTTAPILLTGGVSGWLAVLAAAATMIAVRNDFAAVVAGVAIAAAARAGGF